MDKKTKSWFVDNEDDPNADWIIYIYYLGSIAIYSTFL